MVVDNIDAHEMVVDIFEADSIAVQMITTDEIDGVDGEIQVNDTMVFQPNEGIQFDDGDILDEYYTEFVEGAWDNLTLQSTDNRIHFTRIGNLVTVTIKANNVGEQTVSDASTLNFTTALPVSVRPSGVVRSASYVLRSGDAILVDVLLQVNGTISIFKVIPDALASLNKAVSFALTDNILIPDTSFSYIKY
jgi:hypothetical protein